MWGHRTLLAALTLPVVASGCTLLFPFGAPDEGGAGGCGDCDSCRCVSGDGHDSVTAVDARPEDGDDCCAKIEGDFGASSLRDDWFFFHVLLGEHVVVNPCSESIDLPLEVRLYRDREGTTEVDRGTAFGGNCADSLRYVASADGEMVVQVHDLSGFEGEYTLFVVFTE